MYGPKMTLSVVATKADAIAEMEQAFDRSPEVHHKSMGLISESLTLPKALEALERSDFANTDSLKKVTSLIKNGQNLRATKVDGFGGLDGARRLLNDMISEALNKYDAEIARCTDYYAKQCALMEVARGQISASNFIAATSRGIILDSQSIINQNELRIPETAQELKDHNAQCADSHAGLSKKTQDRDGGHRCDDHDLGNV